MNFFDDVKFEAPALQPTQDDLTALLKSTTVQSTPFMPDTKGGIDRVNTNTKNTSVTAYKGAGGQTTLTNEKIIEAPAQLSDKPYTDQEFRDNNPLVNGKHPDGSVTPVTVKPGQPGSVQKVDTPAAMFNVLSKLRATKDMTEASVLYESFQQSTVEMGAKLEKEAVAFAEQKVGIPNLELMLRQAEAADKSDPKYYPGIGDSPITAKLRGEINAARGVALNEAKTFLSTNPTYKSLAVTAKTAEAEFKRVERLADQSETARLNKEARNEEWDRRKGETDAEYDRRKREKQEEEAEGIPGHVLTRIQMLHQGEFVGLEGKEIDAKIKALKLVKANKSNDFKEAVFAEGDALPRLALKGNKYANALVIAQEAAATGDSPEEVQRAITALQGKMQEAKFVETVFTQRYKGDKKGLSEALGAFQANANDPNKKDANTGLKAELALEYSARVKTANFLQNVNTWKSVDPAIAAAVDRARKTTGRGDLRSTLIAYLGESEGPARAALASQFRITMQQSAERHKDSQLGMPNYREGDAMIAQYLNESGFWRAWMDKTVNSDMAAGLLGAAGVGAAAIAGAPVAGAAALGVGTYMLGRAVTKPLARALDPKLTIDPATGKPFGE